MADDLTQWAYDAYAIAKKAGETLLQYYKKPVPIDYKAGGSPVTEADRVSHRILLTALGKYPLGKRGAVPVLSEEGLQVPFVERQKWEYYWCVDPLDGTREFLGQRDEFAVNVALIWHQRPVIGVVYAPAIGVGYMAWQKGGAYRCVEGEWQQIYSQAKPAHPVRVIVSRRYSYESTLSWLARLGETRLCYQGSALKFCTLACGEADLCLRLSPTSEWDNAAGHCVLEEAGGALFTTENQPLLYNRSGSLEQRNFIAVGGHDPLWERLFLR